MDQSKIFVFYFLKKLNWFIGNLNKMIVLQKEKIKMNIKEIGDIQELGKQAIQQYKNQQVKYFFNEKNFEKKIQKFF